MQRYLVLFARDPGREARAKGFGAAGEHLFETFAAGWRRAARDAGARFVVAAPPEDLPSWRARLGSESRKVLWISQSGSTLGKRVQGVLHRASELPGKAVLVGGDVAPDAGVLRQALDALERGADVILAPAPDGGVSLLAMPAADSDLLATLAPRQRGVVARLRRGLRERGRAVEIIAAAPDIDGRRSLRCLSRDRALEAGLRSLALRILTERTRLVSEIPWARSRTLISPLGLRAPPAAA
ncbi:MAG TPA: DUF2064 domain-containing protein [Thermoanaerobaculia bacterium]